MSAETLKAPGRSLGDWLSEICREGWTGKLATTASDNDGSLYFVAGDLYIAPEHPAFTIVEVWLKETERSAAGEEDGESTAAGSGELPPPSFRQLVGPILNLSAGDDGQDWVFESGAGRIPLDLAGPLPTRQLIMELAVIGLDEHGLLRRLGGDQVALRARSGIEDAAAEVELQPGEGFLLSRLDSPATINDMINQLDLDRGVVLRSLCRLHAVGLVVAAEAEDAVEDTAEPKEQLLSRFERRIGNSLEDEPLEIDPQQHRELLGILLARMGEMTYFEMLAETAQSSDEEIHQAYFELGRLVHPGHAARLGLSGKEGAFRVLFERATDAYLTLNNPERRIEYLREIGPSPQHLADGAGGESRDKEKQEVAREHYERALTLADRQDFHSAIQLLEQSVKVDPQAEYLTLLGDCQAENPQWLDRAAANYRRAMQARPGDPSISSRLGRVLERQGDKIGAKRAYESALEVSPEMEVAKAGLWRVGGGSPTEEKVGLADKLRRFFKGSFAGR